MIRIIPMQLPSIANQRLHWRERARRSAVQRNAVTLAMRVGLGRWRMIAISGARIEVRLTRVASRALDSDNLASAFKAVRDQIAAELGVNDGPRSPLTWVYAQMKPVRRADACVVIVLEAK